MTQLLNENISHDDLKKYLRELYTYASNKLNINAPPRLFLKNDQGNAEDIFGKTGGYDPEREEIHLYVTNRHPKDILRSFCHELVHHAQKLAGFDETIDMSKTASDPAYASHDKGLREMERDAFERGNMIFRDWTDGKKLERNNTMTEKKMHPATVKKAHKIGKKVAKAGGAKEPYAVGMAVAKKLAGKEESVQEKAQKQAEEDMKSRHGKDMEEMDEQGLASTGEGESVEKLQESKEEKENSTHPYPELFTEKERLLKDAFNKKEEIVYQELVRRFIKK